MLVMLVGLSFLFAPSARTFRVPAGQTADNNFTLPDGSRVVLASGSVISFTDRFGEKERRLSLKGEAFFDVVENGAPFHVDTYNARTTVLGTQFSVRAWPTEIEPATIVHVLEGYVELHPRHSDSAPVGLLAGQAGALTSATGTTAEVEVLDIETAFSWVTGGYAYRNEYVGNVLDDLNRRFNVGIEAPASVRLLRISYFKKTAAPISEILDEVSSTVGVRFRKIAGGFELYTP